MALGTTAAIMLGIAGAGAGMAVSGAMSRGGGQSAALPPLPKPPSAVASADKATEVIKKKHAATSQSVFSSPLGIAGQADVTKKTLLGQ